MVIKASAAAEVRSLIEALGAPDDVVREAAIARLAVIGSRAVDRLLSEYPRARDGRTREGILRALETTGDQRTLDVARTAIQEGGDVAAAAAAVLRGLLHSPHGGAAAAALDALVTTALDSTATRHARIAAVDALQESSAAVRARVAEALASDTTLRIESLKRDRSTSAAALDTVWQEAGAGRVPDDPAAVASAVRSRAHSVALSSLQKLVDAVRVKESEARTSPRRAEWRNVRGQIHQALARRGSRIALYDLRETLEDTHAPLPVSFLASLQEVGDLSCLEPIAAAYSRAPADDRWWREQLAAAFRAICRRERVTRRHAVLKRIAARCPDLFP